MKELKIISLFIVSLTIGFLFMKFIDSNIYDETIIIGCSSNINGDWFIKIPDINSPCPETATHWKIYGDRIKN